MSPGSPEQRAATALAPPLRSAREQDGSAATNTAAPGPAVQMCYTSPSPALPSGLAVLQAGELQVWADFSSLHGETEAQEKGWGRGSPRRASPRQQPVPTRHVPTRAATPQAAIASGKVTAAVSPDGRHQDTQTWVQRKGRQLYCEACVLQESAQQRADTCKTLVKTHPLRGKVLALAGPSIVACTAASLHPGQVVELLRAPREDAGTAFPTRRRRIQGSGVVPVQGRQPHPAGSAKPTRAERWRRPWARPRVLSAKVLLGLRSPPRHRDGAGGFLPLRGPDEIKGRGFPASGRAFSPSRAVPRTFRALLRRHRVLAINAMP